MAHDQRAAFLYRCQEQLLHDTAGLPDSACPACTFILRWTTCSLQVMFYCNHWSACVFYFIARQRGFTEDTWVGSNAALVLDGNPKIVRCECKQGAA